MKKIFIPLSKKSPNGYYFNLLRIIALVYHIYIKYELCKLAKNNNTGFSMKVNICREQWVSGMNIIN